MSLINEALKKAQQVQTEGKVSSATAPPSPGSPSSTLTPTPSGQPDLFKVLMGVMIFTIIIAALVAFLVISIIDRNSTGGQVVVVPQPQDIDASSTQSGSTNETANALTPPSIGAGGNNLPAISFKSLHDNKDSQQAPETLTRSPSIADPSSIAENANTSSTQSVPASPGAPHTQTPSQEALTSHNASTHSSAEGMINGPNPVSIAYVDQLQIRGIRISGNNSKLLMGNKVYSINSIINKELKLKIKAIKTRELILIDDAGYTYTKQF